MLRNPMIDRLGCFRPDFAQRLALQFFDPLQRSPLAPINESRDARFNQAPDFRRWHSQGVCASDAPRPAAEGPSGDEEARFRRAHFIVSRTAAVCAEEAARQTKISLQTIETRVS